MFGTLLLTHSVTRADDWPQWLGPQRDGVWRETGIIETFPENGPPVRWRVPVGGGYAGPAVANGRVYVLDRQLAPNAQVPYDPYQRAFIPGSERVLCLDEKDGTLLWKHEYDCPYTISYPAGPRCTPTVDDGKVYTLGAEGHLFCLDAETGAVLWSKDFKKDYNLTVPVWGVASHPLVDGQKLICVVGGQGGTAVAFDKDTGEELWKALGSREPGYCPPVIFEAGGKRQLIIWHAEAVNSLDPETGEVYWSEPLEATFGMAVSTPRKMGDLLFITSFPDKSMMLKLDSEKPAASVLWRGTQRSSVYSILSTPYLEDGYIYGTCADGQFRCVEAQTGERVWETFAPTTGDRRARWASAFLIKNGDRFFLPNEKGDLIIAKLSPEGYQEISRAHLLEATGMAGGRNVVWSHPAFANRRIFARNDKEIVCASLAAEESTGN